MHRIGSVQTTTVAIRNASDAGISDTEDAPINETPTFLVCMIFFRNIINGYLDESSINSKALYQAFQKPTAKYKEIVAMMALDSGMII